jgi:hypothetical protein
MSVVQNLFLLKIVAWFVPPESCEQNDWMTKGKYKRVNLWWGTIHVAYWHDLRNAQKWIT